jgi:hypothetical protein
MRKTKYSWRRWYFTNAKESLFDLTAEEFYIFSLLCEEALRL